MILKLPDWKASYIPNSAGLQVYGDVYTEDTPRPEGVVGWIETILTLSPYHSQSHDASILRLCLTLTPKIRDGKKDLWRGNKRVHYLKPPASEGHTYKKVQVFYEDTSITITVI